MYRARPALFASLKSHYLLRRSTLAIHLSVALLVLLTIAQPATADEAEQRHVIMISIDGLAGFYFDDERAAIPTLRKLAADGAISTQMKCSFPTVTWPNHTTLVTGVPPAVHGVLGNNVIDRTSQQELRLIGDSRFDKVDLVRAPTIYDAAHAAGLTTTAVLWPATRNAPTLTRTLPDVYSQELFERHATPEWYAELLAEGIPVDKRGDWVNADDTMARCDWITTRAAAQAIRKYQPQLLLMHLLVCDSVQHKYGPRTPEAYWALGYADDRVREILDAVESAGLTSRTAILIVSDHGFFAIDKVIKPNVVLKQQGLLQANGRDIVHRDAYSLSQGGAAPVYIYDRTQAAELTPRLVEAFSNVEGIEKVVTPDEFDSLGQPTPRDNPWAADLWLAAEDGYVFWHGVEGDQAVTHGTPPGGPTYRGMHGYLPGHRNMRGTLIVSGNGARSGVQLEDVANIDVAPTIARLLKIEFPSAEGKAVEPALAP